jgi:uncharacterized protein (DUF362 family)
MDKKINRRSFIKQSAIVGVSSMVGGNVIPHLISNTSLFGNEKVDIAAIKGADPFASTIKAIQTLGGMKKFVSKGATVGLLANSPWKNPGSYTIPEVVLAVIKLCVEAGAKEIISIENVSNGYWDRSELSKKFSEEIKSVKAAGKNRINFVIEKGKNLKEANIEKALLDCDVFINIPKIKDHTGTRFTGCLKNMMGASGYQPTNHFIHFGETGKTWKDGGYSDVEWLSQCIADLALVRKPDLCVADATEILLTNGPAGPGEIAKPQCIVVGVDPVAVDAYCTRFVNLTGNDILLIKRAFEHELGEIDIKKLKVKEV